jgi:hypothetical protein
MNLGLFGGRSVSLSLSFLLLSLSLGSSLSLCSSSTQDQCLSHSRPMSLPLRYTMSPSAASQHQSPVTRPCPGRFPFLRPTPPGPRSPRHPQTLRRLGVNPLLWRLYTDLQDRTGTGCLLLPPCPKRHHLLHLGSAVEGMVTKQTRRER